MQHHRAAEAGELGQGRLGASALAFARGEHGEHRSQAPGEHGLIVESRLTVGVQHHKVVDLRQGLEDAGEALGLRLLLRCGLPCWDHLKRRLVVDMDDFVEAGAAGGELGKARAAPDAELCPDGAVGQVDQYAQSLVRALLPGDANGFMGCVDLCSRCHDENGARSIGRRPAAEMSEHIVN